jgi:hypothetical protein
MYQDPDEGDFIGVFCFQRDIKRGANGRAGARFFEGFARISLAWWFARQGQ